MRPHTTSTPWPASHSLISPTTQRGAAGRCWAFRPARAGTDRGRASQQTSRRASGHRSHLRLDASQVSWPSATLTRRIGPPTSPHPGPPRSSDSLRANRQRPSLPALPRAHSDPSVLIRLRKNGASKPSISADLRAGSHHAWQRSVAACVLRVSGPAARSSRAGEGPRRHGPLMWRACRTGLSAEAPACCAVRLGRAQAHDYTGDLRRDWAIVTSGYLLHLASKGNAASTILRQRAGLNDCAACLGLPRVTIPAPPDRNGCPTPAAAGPTRRGHS